MILISSEIYRVNETKLVVYGQGNGIWGVKYTKKANVLIWSNVDFQLIIRKS
jgi:hypothetical protein